MTPTRLLAAVLLAALITAPARAGEEGWRAGRTTVRIPLRDGKSLAADVHLPEKSGRYPAVVIQTPYGKRHHGAAGPGRERGVYDRENYAYVVVDWRGFHGSRDARVKGRPRRGRDGYDVVEWTAAQPWCDGKIGTWGPSALGKVQYDTAVERPPHLVCSIPLVASYGTRYEDYYEGGVLREAHLGRLSQLGFGSMSAVRRAPRPDARIWEWALELERYERIEVPMLVITGWYDHGTTRQLETFELLLAKGGERTREASRLLVGPWHHTALDEEEQGEVAYPGAVGEIERETRAFFDHHLRGTATNGWAERGRVRVWRCNEDGWREADAWPGDGTRATVLHLRADGSLTRAAPATDEAARVFVDDPSRPTPTVGGANLPGRLAAGPANQARVSGREDVLAYTSAPLDRPLRLAGRARLVVTLRVDRPDTDVAVRLCDVDAEGRSMLVADTIQRASLQGGRLELLAGDDPHEVIVELPPLAYTFRKGRRLQVLLSGTNWPRFARNTHTRSLAWSEDDAVPARVSLLHGRSRLELPVRPEEDARRGDEGPAPRPKNEARPGGGR